MGLEQPAGTGFTVDPGALPLTGVSLTEAIGIARQVQQHGSTQTALVGQCGDRQLHDAACSFIARWAYGAGLIAEDGQRLASMLRAAGTQYTEVENAVTAAET